MNIVQVAEFAARFERETYQQMNSKVRISTGSAVTRAALT